MNSTSWFMHHQPKTVEQYVFESSDQRSQAIDWINNSVIPANLVLFGPAGTGKTALAELLIRAIIKNQHDLNRIVKRSVKDIDELAPWLQKRPLGSKKKIVYIEEFDKLSNEAKGTLKDGMMEKFQEYVTFICTTNHFNRIDHALQTRFTYQFNLTCTNIDGVFLRLVQILNDENVAYDSDKLRIFVNKNISMGLRDLINTLQVNSIHNQIDFDKIILQKSEQEEEIINLRLSMIEEIIECHDINSRKLCVTTPANSLIAKQYISLIEIIQYNQNIDYYEIFNQLMERIQYFPIKSLINQFSSQLDNKHSLYVHYIDFLYRALKCIVEVNI